VISDPATGRRIEITTMAEALYEAMPRSPEAVALVTEAYLQSGRTDRAIRFIDTVLAGEDATGPVVLTLAEVSRRHGLGQEARLLDRVRGDDAVALDLSFADAYALADGGDVDGGLAVIDAAAADAAADAGEMIRRRRIAFLDAYRHPAALDAVRSLVEQSPASPDALSFALGTRAIWKRPELVRQAIDGLETLLGCSTRAPTRRPSWPAPSC
jgi:hypothetical protein